MKTLFYILSELWHSLNIYTKSLLIASLISLLSLICHGIN